MRLARLHCILALAAAYDACAQEVIVEALDDNRYRLSLTAETALGVEAAQKFLLPTAEALCEDLSPVFGRYRFSSTEPIAGGNLNEGSSGFTFSQEIQCAVANRSAAAITIPPTIDSDVEAEEVKNTIRVRSIEYFDKISNERYKEAYTFLADSLRAFSTPESWEAEKRSFRSAVGAPVSLQVVRLTIYDNPPDAPEPGLYVAADFNNEYENAPIHCGYLMWFRGDGGEFRMIREESGHVTSDQLATIPGEQVPVIRQRLRCVAP